MRSVRGVVESEYGRPCNLFRSPNPLCVRGTQLNEAIHVSIKRARVCVESVSARFNVTKAAAEEHTLAGQHSALDRSRFKLQGCMSGKPSEQTSLGIETAYLGTT